MIDNLELCRWAYNEMKHGQTERVRMKQEGKQISFHNEIKKLLP
jgi:hypothetical protein